MAAPYQVEVDPAKQHLNGVSGAPALDYLPRQGHPGNDAGNRLRYGANDLHDVPDGDGNPPIGPVTWVPRPRIEETSSISIRNTCSGGSLWPLTVTLSTLRHDDDREQGEGDATLAAACTERTWTRFDDRLWFCRPSERIECAGRAEH